MRRLWRASAFLRRSRSALLAAPLLLAGCASLMPQAPLAEAGVAAPAARTYYDAIDMAGRISALYQQAGRDEAVHGNFTWSQSPGRTVVTLLSPLGQTLAVIELTPERATLTQAGQPPQQAGDSDALAERMLGWPLPVAGLRFWLQGVGRDAQGRPFTAAPVADTFTTTDGWTLHYVTWEDTAPLAAGMTPASTQASALPRPRRLDLQRTTREAGPVTLRLALDTWEPRQAMP
jgi:outer membrane lipoprotein LolB